MSSKFPKFHTIFPRFCTKQCVILTQLLAYQNTVLANKDAGKQENDRGIDQLGLWKRGQQGWKHIFHNSIRTISWFIKIELN